jgi:hypothetical protein
MSIDPAFSQSALVLDTQSRIHLTSFPTSRSIIDDQTTYYWRVKHFDNGNLDSDWSDAFSFTTTGSGSDTNGNGIPDAQELEPGSLVDLNGDGVPDVNQITGQYKVLETILGEGPIGVESPANATIASVESVDPAIFPDTPEGSKPETLFLGLLNFRIRVQTPGDPVDLNIYFSTPAPGNSRWFKFSTNSGWGVLPESHAIFHSDRNSLVLNLKDGGPDDDDGVENGFIVDPGGVGALVSSTPPPDGEAGIEDNCFITTASADRKNTAGAHEWTWGNFSIPGAILLMFLMIRVICGRKKCKQLNRQKGQGKNGEIAQDVDGDGDQQTPAHFITHGE